MSEHAQMRRLFQRNRTPEQRENLTKLLAAMRSGKYRQARHVLRQGTTKDYECFCAVGLACEISNTGTWSWNLYVSKHKPPVCIANHYGLTRHAVENVIIDWNDRQGLSFWEIADRLEEQDTLESAAT